MASSMFPQLARFFVGRDVFISYSYSDSAYAEALGLALRERGLTVFVGGSEAPPGPELSPRVVRAANFCGLLAVVATPAALASRAVQQEVAIVTKRGRTVIPIDMGGALNESRWPGTAPVREDADTPSPEVVARIENSVRFSRQQRRLQFFIAAVTAGAVLVIAAATLLSALARRDARRAETERSRAVLQQRAAEAEARKAAATATEARRQAAAAETARSEADADRQRQIALASALSLANESNLLLSRDPRQLRRAALLAAAAAKRLQSLDAHALAADTALRESLVLLPLIEKRIPWRSRPMAITDDARFVAEVVDETAVRIRDLESGAVRRLPPLEGDFRTLSIDISGDGGTVITQVQRVGQFVLRVRRTADGAVLSSREGSGYAKTALSHDGSHYAMTAAGKRGTWRATVYRADGTELRSTEFPAASNEALRFSRSGRLIAFVALHPRVWEWQTEKPPVAWPVGGLATLVFHPRDEDIVCVASETDIAVWNWRSWNTTEAHPLFRDQVPTTMRVSFSADGDAIGYATDPAGEARYAAWTHRVQPVFRLADAGRFSEAAKAVRVIMGDTDRSAAVVYADGTVTQFADLEPVGRVSHESGLRAAALVRNGGVRSISDSEAIVWRARPIRPTIVAEGPRPIGIGARAARSPSGKVSAEVVGWTDVHVGPPSTTSPIELPHGSEVSCVAFADEETLLTGTKDAVSVWAWRRGVRLERMHCPDWVRSIASDPQQRFVAAAAANAVFLWPRGRGAAAKAAATIPHDGRVLAVAFSKSGRFLATATEDSRLHVWSNWDSAPVEIARIAVSVNRLRRSIISANEAAATYLEGEGIVYDLAFADDDRYLDALVDGRHERVIWRSSELLAAACERLGVPDGDRDRDLYRQTCGR